MTGVTVALACYQGGAYLPLLLDSLARQDSAFTVLAQDDGSTDGTAELLAGLAERDPRFRLGSECGRHLGAAGNFLSLIRQADTPYLALCDQDDLWEPRRLSAGLEAMRAAEARFGTAAPLLVHSDCSLIDADGRPLAASFFRRQGWDPQAVSLAELLVQNNVTGCTVLMNAPLYRFAAAHARAEQLFMHDWFLALSAAALGQICFVDQPLVRYRQHGANVLGASREGLARRALRALREGDRARARIALTYRHSRAFLEACGPDLPDTARQTVETYLATETMPKLRRLRAIRRGGYRMQSPMTRAGQLLFG